MEESGGILGVSWLPLLAAETENLKQWEASGGPNWAPSFSVATETLARIDRGTKDETGGQSPSRELTAALLPLPTCGETGQDWFKVHYR